MTEEEMTVHQALCEVKVLGKRIKGAINDAKFVAVKANNDKKVNGISIDEFNEQAKASNDKIKDLINRYYALKAAINQYNASTTVKIGKKDYTVAEAIWIQDYGLDEKKNYLNNMIREYNSAQQLIEDSNGERLTNRAEQFVTNMYGSKDKIDNGEFMKAVDDYKTKNECVLVDPIGIKQAISDLQDEIDAFESEADATIQVSNATNTIKIEY